MADLLKDLGLDSDDAYTVIPKTSLILRKQGDKLLIIGSGLSIPAEIVDDEEYLFVGELILAPQHIFKEYIHDKGNTPNELLSLKKGGGGLNYSNYKTKVK